MSVALNVRPIIDPFLKIASRSWRIRMTCETFCETHFDAWLCDYIQESYWDDSFNTDHAFDRMEREAARLGVRLTDIETWNYDAYLTNAYRCTEKGLS